MPDAVGVPDIVITFPDQEALTPPGNPFAPATPSSLIPVAPVVACVIFVNAVFIHKVGVLDATPAVFIVIVAPDVELPLLYQAILDTGCMSNLLTE